MSGITEKASTSSTTPKPSTAKTKSASTPAAKDTKKSVKAAHAKTTTAKAATGSAVKDAAAKAVDTVKATTKTAVKATAKAGEAVVKAASKSSKAAKGPVKAVNPTEASKKTAKRRVPVPPKLSSADQQELDFHLHLFHEGNDSRAYRFLGAHAMTVGGKDGVMFRVWAPNARSVSVIGDFNDWNRDADPCAKISVGVWAAFVPGLSDFVSYKFDLEGPDGRHFEKADPYAFHAETRPHTASKVFELDGYAWGDNAWCNARQTAYNRPMNIYEVHLGSWRHGNDGRLLSYGETANLLIPYVKEMGYTHIELMPVMEHPFDGSWGYQTTGHFAPTSRYGTPHDFMALVDECHQAGLGVILDWVPAHFPKDPHGLVEFDGDYCYEYHTHDRMEHPEWGTRVFDFGRNEVRSFLMSAALYWLDLYHVDGLRVDAVSSMLYLDYGRKKGQWTPNVHGGNENLEAISFLRALNEQVFAAHPNALMVAEESTAWPMVTKPAYMGGLGFNFKWNMGWMNDTLHYAKLDPIFRQYNHNNLTFSIMYAFSENFILPFSHDEVVHGKCSLIEKMPGYYVDKFAGVRSFLSYMIAHPGKKLSFMGNEFGQFIEWNFAESLDWHLLTYEMHDKLSRFVKTLNNLYLDQPALWTQDCTYDGFDWLSHGDNQGNTIAFRRIDENGGELIAVFNFSSVNKEHFRLGVENPGAYVEILNSDHTDFGGMGRLNPYDMNTYEQAWNEKPHSLECTLPPFSAIFLKRRAD